MVRGPEFDPHKTHVKKPGTVAHACIPSVGDEVAGSSRGTVGQTTNPRAPVSVMSHPVLTSGPHMHVYTHAHEPA